MAEPTPLALVEFMRDNQLLTLAQAQQLDQLRAQFPEVRMLAREMVRRGWLTPYQANQLVQGHGSDLVLGPYRILERLGEGGMGQVFKARHVRMDRLVALKVIHRQHLAGLKAVQRFMQEARAAAQLSHPNIVLAHDANDVAGRHFLAMEYVEGTDLAKLVEQSGPLPVWQACDFARQAALGLQHAHERGLVHRDIKPSNLIVTRGGPGAPPVVKILDFGLARFESEAGHGTRLTRIDSFVGTLDFISPEQADNAGTVDIRADIYSLGCSLFFLLTGRPPFPGDSAAAKIGARLTREAPSPRALRREIPATLESVLAKMMAREPGARYQAPAEVAAALEPFTKLEGQGSTPVPHLRPLDKTKLPGERAALDSLFDELTQIGPSAEAPKPARNRSVLAGAVIGAAAIVCLGVGTVTFMRPRDRPAAPGPVAQDKNTPETVNASKPATKPSGDAKPGVTASRGTTPPLAVAPFDAKGAQAYQVAWAKHLSIKSEATNSIGMKLVLIPPGKFRMGSTPEEIECFKREPDAGETLAWVNVEGPQHEVTITKPFFMGIYEVTQGQYEKVMGNNPSYNKESPDRPVEQVNLDDAVAFCKRLSGLPEERRAGRTYRLPKEAEWEYACRAGTTTRFHYGDSLSSRQANFDGRKSHWGAEEGPWLGKTVKVGSYRPNAWGLYDMHGNVGEWCLDWARTYTADPVEDPRGLPPVGERRLLRGGNWSNNACYMRTALRTLYINHRGNNMGFRVVCELPR
jgi:formylglycine-generating enzyme required for sulfatase activity